MDIQPSNSIYYGEPNLELNWVPIRVSSFGITVCYQEKYGQAKTIQAIGLWESKSEYRITFKGPEFITLQKANVISIGVE
jgi:hypothetical protein